MAALSLATTANTSISRRQVRKSDVICSKMKFAFNHPGNATFRMLVRKYRAAYQCARRDEKSKYISYIRKAIVDEGGQFLRPGSGESLEFMDELQTNEKISHALRCCNVPVKKHNNKPPREERSFEYFLQIQRRLLAHIQQTDSDNTDTDLSEILGEDYHIPLFTPEHEPIPKGTWERSISIDSDVLQILSDIVD
jgi:hypothetical protein